MIRQENSNNLFPRSFVGRINPVQQGKAKNRPPKIPYQSRLYLLSIKYLCSDAKGHILENRYCFSEFDRSLLQIPIGEDYRLSRGDHYHFVYQYNIDGGREKLSWA
jgi:hypothetical protein